MGKKRAYNSYSLIYDETIVNSVDISTQWIGQFSVEEILNSVDQQYEEILNSVDIQKKKTKTTKKQVVVLPSAEGQVLENKSDRLRVMGAIQKRYANQIMTSLPSERKIMDLLELYAIDKIEEAIERLPLVLTPKNLNTKITGDYVIGIIDKWVKNPAWGKPEGNVDTTPKRPPPRDSQQETIDGIEHRFSWYREGKMHPDGFSHAISVYNRLIEDKGKVAASPDDFTMSIADYDKALALWEGRE